MTIVQMPIGARSFGGPLGGLAALLILSAAPGLALAQSFEQPPVLNAVQLLGADNTTSPLYTVDPSVRNDGLYNHFVIKSAIFNAEPTGNDMAEERLAEIRAIDTMRQVKGTDAYATGLGNAISGTLAASKEVITHPIQTLSDLPSNIGRVIGDVFSALGNMGKSDADTDDTLKNLIGYNQAKRALADSLDVDPYSSNSYLQQELDDLAWVTFAGNATLEIPLAISGAGTVVTGIRIAAGTEDPLRNASPTSLVNINTQLLKEMGVEEEEADRFLFGKVLNIRHQTYIVHALATLSDVPGRDAFIRLATDAQTEHQARELQATAVLIAAYHRDAAAVKRIEVRQGSALITDTHGIVVLPLAADHVAWTAATAAVVDRLPAGTASKALWTTGTVSAGARSALAARRITLQDLAFSRVAPDLEIRLTRG